MTLADLEKICSEATPGPWEYSALGLVEAEGGRIATVDSVSDYRDKIHQNANFIATFNPETVKKLLAVAKAAKAYMDGDTPYYETPLAEALAALEG